MIWYNIEYNELECVVFKNLIKNHSIGCLAIYRGSEKECKKYCKSNEIRLGVRYGKKI